MKAVCWMGKHDVQVMNVPDPTILNDRDAIIKITKTAICGSDLHLYNGYIPSMQEGDILGHEFMGEVVETGSAVSNLKQGDKVVVPFTISCGKCFFCEHEMFSVCDNSNPKPEGQETAYGFAGSGLFGFSHLMGGFAGGQLGALLAKLFGEEPSQQVYGDLYRFKSMMESGEIITVEGQTSGREPRAKSASA